MLPPALVPKLAPAEEAAEKGKGGGAKGAGAAKDDIRADSLVEAFDPVRQSWSIAKVRQVSLSLSLSLSVRTHFPPPAPCLVHN